MRSGFRSGAAIPFLATTTLAAAATGLSFLAFRSLLGSLAAFTQVFASPAIGALVGRAGFTPLCVTVARLPLSGLVILQVILRAEPAGPSPPPPR